jgi:hypothetical protein
MIVVKALPPFGLYKLYCPGVSAINGFIGHHGYGLFDCGG